MRFPLIPRTGPEKEKRGRIVSPWGGRDPVPDPSATPRSLCVSPAGRIGNRAGGARRLGHHGKTNVFISHATFQYNRDE